MKLALAFMFRSDEIPYLRLHLPVFKDSFDGVVALTDFKTTNAFHLNYVARFADLAVAEWKHDWGLFATMLANRAEELGYDAVCRIDPDECLMPDAGYEIKRLLEHEATLLVLPRHEFFGDRRHVRAEMYPDAQARAWRLRRGIVVQGHRHEGIDFTAHGLYEGHGDPDKRVLRPTNPHIYHYGWLGKQGVWRNQVKYTNHDRADLGLPPLSDISHDIPLVQLPTVEFHDPQPLDPNIIGLTAPFKE